MKRLTFYLFLTGLTSIGLVSFKPVTSAQKIDLTKSSIAWVGYKVTGKHSGAVNLKSGELKFEGSKLMGGTFEIDMTSITVMDPNGPNDRLANHLKSEDFFSVAKYPSCTFKISTVNLQSKESYKITGDLTIKGITKPISFDATFKEENGTKIADAFMKINRTDFDIKYRSASFFESIGDKAISDEFDLKVKLVTVK